MTGAVPSTLAPWWSTGPAVAQEVAWVAGAVGTWLNYSNVIESMNSPICHCWS